MTRVLRYPRMSMAICALSMFCALWRDFCVEDGLMGWARVLLYATFLLLALGMVLLSCRFFVDHHGVGVGVLLHVRRTSWDQLASLGVLCCNSRRMYLYGMYRGNSDFLNLLYRAPQCGPWGFVVPLNKRIIRAVSSYCPYDVDFSPIEPRRPSGRMRPLWHQAALYLLVLLPAAIVAFATGGLVVLRASMAGDNASAFVLTLSALLLFALGMVLLHRAYVAVQTCPRIGESGVSAGRAIFLTWDDVRYGFIHRHAPLSGMFLLSENVTVLQGRSAPPVRCLSLPDTHTLTVACQHYCARAELRNLS